MILLVLAFHALHVVRAKLIEVYMRENCVLSTHVVLVDSRDLINMGSVILTLKLMPESPETDLPALTVDATKLIEEFGAEVGKVEEVPVAFGLKALMLTIIYNEDMGSTDSVEEKISALENVNSVDVTSVTRAMG